MTSQGNAYARFRRALERGNVTATLAAAAELRQLGLTDALEVCLVLRSDPSQFERLRSRVLVYGVTAAWASCFARSSWTSAFLMRSSAWRPAATSRALRASTTSSVATKSFRHT